MHRCAPSWGLPQFDFAHMYVLNVAKRFLSSNDQRYTCSICYNHTKTNTQKQCTPPFRLVPAKPTMCWYNAGCGRDQSISPWLPACYRWPLTCVVIANVADDGWRWAVTMATMRHNLLTCVIIVHPVEHDFWGTIPACRYVTRHLIIRLTGKTKVQDLRKYIKFCIILLLVHVFPFGLRNHKDNFCAKCWIAIFQNYVVRKKSMV